MTTIEELTDAWKPYYHIEKPKKIKKYQDLLAEQFLAFLTIDQSDKPKHVLKKDWKLIPSLVELGMHSYTPCFLPSSEYTHFLPFSHKAGVNFPEAGTLFMFEAPSPSACYISDRKFLVERDILLPEFYAVPLNKPRGGLDTAEQYVRSYSEKFHTGRVQFVLNHEEKYLLPVILPNSKIVEVRPQLLTMLARGASPKW